MRAQVSSSPDDIDITSLWTVLKRSGPKVLVVSGMVGALTFGVLTLMPSKFKSEAQIRIGAQGDTKGAPNATAEVVTLKQDREAIISQVAELQSRDLAAKLAAELKLAQRSEFNAALPDPNIVSKMLRMVGLGGARPGETEEERVLNAYYKALRVYQVRDSRVITIEFQSSDRELAARAANRLAELHQEALRSQVVTSTQETNDWLKPQIEKLSREVAEAEAGVESFRRQTDQFRGGGATSSGLNEQQLTDLSAEVTKVRTARAEAEARARSARELLQRNMADAIPDVQKSPVIQGLIAQRVRSEREKAEAETQLLAGHPRMKQLNANVADLRRQVNREAVVIVEGLEKDAKMLALREELAAKSLEDMKARMGSKSGDIARLASLEGQAKAKRKELEGLQATYESSRSRVDVKSVPLEAHIFSTARPSSVPHSPKKPQLAGLASAATLILGLVFVVTRELLAGARRGGAPAHLPGDAPPAAAAAPVGVARATASASRMASAVGPAPASPMPAQAAPSPSAADEFKTFAAVDAVARRIAGNAEAQGGYRTVVVGETAGLDANEEAVDLAASLTASGKQVVLVDWSFDGAGMAEALGLDATPGFMDLIEGRASFEDVIRRLPDGDAHVVPCGKAQLSAPGKLDADRINLVLDALDEAYDHIVVVGPHAAISELFLAIQGRFDAGVLVSDSRQSKIVTEAAPGTFLGYQVTDIDVVRLDRGGLRENRKMQLARSAGRPETRV